MGPTHGPVNGGWLVKTARFGIHGTDEISVAQMRRSDHAVPDLHLQKDSLYLVDCAALRLRCDLRVRGPQPPAQAIGAEVPLERPHVGPFELDPALRRRNPYEGAHVRGRNEPNTLEINGHGSPL